MSHTPKRVSANSCPMCLCYRPPLAIANAVTCEMPSSCASVGVFVFLTRTKIENVKEEENEKKSFHVRRNQSFAPFDHTQILSSYRKINAVTK